MKDLDTVPNLLTTMLMKKIRDLLIKFLHTDTEAATETSDNDVDEDKINPPPVFLRDHHTNTEPFEDDLEK